MIYHGLKVVLQLRYCIKTFGTGYIVRLDYISVIIKLHLSYAAFSAFIGVACIGVVLFFQVLYLFFRDTFSHFKSQSVTTGLGQCYTFSNVSMLE